MSQTDHRSSLFALLIGLCFVAAATPTLAQPKRVLDFDPDWTPRPQAGDVPAYVKETDVDWVDPRLQQMDTGRTWNATFRYPHVGSSESEPPLLRSFKGTAIRIGDDGEAAIIFDRNQLRWACAWTGDYLTHSDRRFGLLNTPQPAGDVQFSTVPLPEATTGPMPCEQGRYLGLHRHGAKVVLSYTVGSTRIDDSPWIEHPHGFDVFTRSIRVDGASEPLSIPLIDTPHDFEQVSSGNSFTSLIIGDKQLQIAIGLAPGSSRGTLQRDDDGRVTLDVSPSERPQVFKVLFVRDESIASAQFFIIARESPKVDIAQFSQWTSPGPRQWTEHIATQGKIAADNAAYVIDTIGVPFENPYKALMFLSGVDFVGDDVYASTIHGDVWKLTGVDDDLDEVVWQRYATGLYQPLGLKVVDGKVMVLERGQLTRLHDLNDDGEADFYESFNADWHVGGGEHSFDTCLETDPAGNFYFHSTGDPHVPTGGTVMKVSADGKQSEVFCTGFRHPIGMGVLPDGRITGADQEGNWMPSTRIDIYQKGGFYGDFRAHHRDPPPETYDSPLCWLPRQLDGSAGGQVSVPGDQWGHLAGRTLHMSFGRCRMMLLMMQKLSDVEQAGAVDLGLQFDAGIQRGRFRPTDGHLYLVGMDGWQTAAIADGCLQRVRYTGQRWMSPTELEIEPHGIRLTFSEPLDRDIAALVERYHIEQWNYLWSGEYGSARYSVESPGEEGQDEVAITKASVSSDGREVFLSVPNLAPVMQMQIDYRLVGQQGEDVKGVVYNTIHTTGG